MHGRSVISHISNLYPVPLSFTGLVNGHELLQGLFYQCLEFLRQSIEIYVSDMANDMRHLTDDIP